MKIPFCLSLIVCLSLTAGAAAAEHNVKVLDEAPPADELSSDIAELLADKGVKVYRGTSRTVVDIWLTKSWDVKPGFEAGATVLYPFEMGQLIGVARYKNKGEDFRGQEIPAGVYTLRYGLQPVDGNHVGTSDTRDFLLLLPAEQDTSPDPINMFELFAKSKQAVETTHPGILSLLRVGDNEAKEPVVAHHEDRDLWSVVLTNAAKAGDEDKMQQIEIVVAGHAEE